MKRLTLLALSLLVLFGCKSSESNKGKPEINLKYLVGSWEMVSLTVNDRTVPAKLNSSASQAGYAGSSEKMQYEITDTKFKVISSDELAVSSSFAQDYHVDGNNIVLEVNSKKVSNIEVVSLTASALSVRGNNSTPANLVLNFARINVSDLATNKMKPIAQSSTFSIQASNVKASDSTQVLNAEMPEADNGRSISCYFENKKTKGIRFTAFQYQKTADGIKFGGDDPSLSAIFDVNFDFKKPAEDFVGGFVPSSTNVIRGVIVSGATKTSFQTTVTSQCMIKGHRDHRSLSFAIDCLAVDAYSGRTSVDGQLTSTTSCLLRF